MVGGMNQTPPRQDFPAETEPFLPLRTVVILLTAIFLGCVVGVLSWRTGVSDIGSLVIALGSAGTCVPSLNTLIGGRVQQTPGCRHVND